MPTEQSLKKKLQVIRSTQKTTQAMKTASTVKYSKLNTRYGEYKEYAAGCEALFDRFQGEFQQEMTPADPAAPVCFLVLTGNKGMCGSFNSELLDFCGELLEKEPNKQVFVCGKKGIEFFSNKGLALAGSCVLSDVPTYEEAKGLLQQLMDLLEAGKISAIKTVYPAYINMMRQEPVCKELIVRTEDAAQETGEAFFVPDRATVIRNTAQKILISIMYKRILETALGAQAATLTTMRSAYDTACEYSAKLETQINRMRQTRVTADVLEVAAEYQEE